MPGEGGYHYGNPVFIARARARRLKAERKKRESWANIQAAFAAKRGK